MLIGGGIMARRQRARLQQITEGLRPDAARHVLVRYEGDAVWIEHVKGEAVPWTDDEVQAAEAAGEAVSCIEVVYVDGEDWRLPVG